MRHISESFIYASYIGVIYICVIYRSHLYMRHISESYIYALYIGVIYICVIYRSHIYMRYISESFIHASYIGVIYVYAASYIGVTADDESQPPLQKASVVSKTDARNPGTNVSAFLCCIVDRSLKKWSHFDLKS